MPAWRRAATLACDGLRVGTARCRQAALHTIAVVASCWRCSLASFALQAMCPEPSGCFGSLTATCFLPVVVSAEEAGAGKATPDVYLEACRRLAVNPSDGIAVEDSALGACAAAQFLGAHPGVVAREPRRE
jgi:hypothetical protein